MCTAGQEVYVCTWRLRDLEQDVVHREHELTDSKGAQTPLLKDEGHKQRG